MKGDNLSVRSAREQLQAIYGAKDFMRSNQRETPDMYIYYQKQIDDIDREEAELNSWLEANGGNDYGGDYEEEPYDDAAAQEEISHFNDDLYGGTEDNYKPVIDNSEADTYNQNEGTVNVGAELTRKLFEDWYAEEDGGWEEAYAEYLSEQNKARLSEYAYTDPVSGEPYNIAPDGEVTPTGEPESPVADLGMGFKAPSGGLNALGGGINAIGTRPSGAASLRINGNSNYNNTGRIAPANLNNSEYGAAIQTPIVAVSPAVSKYSDDLGYDNTNQLPSWDELIQSWKELTKRGDLDGFLSVTLGTYKDKKGIYHIKQNSWQTYFGYNEVYDDVFRASTSMNSTKFTFEYEGQEYMIWAWKGDYINLGAGAELGIYTRIKFNNEKGEYLDHWPADPSLAMPMTMTLYYNGEPIITYDPNSDDPDNQSKKKWWLNSFNPQHQGVKASELTATYTIDFSEKPELYEAFIHSDDYLNNQSKWTISEENKYLLTFTFDWEG